MADPTEKGGADYRAYCLFERERQCRGDCVAFDPNGARDTTGRLTSCRLINDVAGIRAAVVTIGNHFRMKDKELPGSNVAPPRVGG